ncbi:hypothetical protein EON79_23910, partial [bacterium]
MVADVRSTKGSRAGRIAWSVVTVLACAHFALSYATNHRQFLDLARYADGLERTPYQYRVLMAWVLKLLGENPAVGRLAHVFPGDLKAPYVFVEMGLAFLALLGAVLATRRSLRILSGHDAFSAWASLLVVYMAQFQFNLSYGLNYVLPYDLPSVFFFCLALLGIVSKSRTLFYAAFVVGTLNRETMVFAVVPFAVWGLYEASGERIEKGWGRVLPHVVGQLLLWV